MKIISLSLIFQISLSITLFGQWIWQNPLPQGNRIFDADYVNESVIYAVGNSGTIIKSEDSGANWAQLSSGTDVELYSVCFTDVNTGIVAGLGGTLMKTDNGGSTWEVLESHTYEDIYSVFFVNEDTAYAVGKDVIIKSTDGGNNWLVQKENLDLMLARRKMSLTELSNQVGITMANLSILKKGKAKAIRFSSLEAICKSHH